MLAAGIEYHDLILVAVFSRHWGVGGAMVKKDVLKMDEVWGHWGHWGRTAWPAAILIRVRRPRHITGRDTRSYLPQVTTGGS
jgi:hypothetical protein